jgi:hypothetical protein
MVRPLALCLLLAALASCGPHRPPGPVAFAAAEDAAQAVCITPASHREIAETVRKLNWPILSRDQIPAQVVGNDMVAWSDVALSPDGNMIIATGRLGGTSYCRVYRRQKSEAPLTGSLQRTPVLGSPLGKPDFRQHINGGEVTGWHKGGADWRAVHVWEAEATNSGGAEMPVMIEITRSAA